MAAERDRWPHHWQVADLELEEESLLGQLHEAEELRAVVPGMRTTAEGDIQILVGVTDRRVVVVGRRRGVPVVGVLDVTDCATTAARADGVYDADEVPFAFDLDEDSVARVWATIDDVVPTPVR